MYHREKREAGIKPTLKEMSISIGSINDSFETLKTMCNDKCIELMKTIELSVGEEREVVFWTADIPELIGSSKIIKNGAGQMSFTLDTSLSTL